jgi:hypothetical protein
MASKSTKGLHRTLALVVDGVQQVGSFTKVVNFTATPDAEIKKSDHLGEPESEVDMMHHGWNFQFGIEEQDSAAAKVYESIANAATDGRTLPRVDLIEIRTYVDGSLPVETFLYQEAVMKMDSDESGGRKEYNKTMFSGACKRRVRL